MQNVITFPGLGLTLNINRIAFSIGNLHVYWYGILIAVGFLLAMWYACKRVKLTGILMDHLLDAVLVGIPLGIIGARALYVIFKYNELYYYDFWGMFRIWDGGSAIFGGLTLAIAGVLVYCKIRRLRVGALLDLAAPCILLAQTIGRWGNFTNQELYGTAATGFLRMGLYVGGNYIEVHPIFLYESLWTLLGFIFLHFYFKRRKYNGEIFLMAAFWYGLGRCICEPLKDAGSTLFLGNSNLRVNLLFAALTCILALGGLFYLYLFRERDPESLTHPYLPKKEKKKDGEEEAEAPAEADGDENVIGGIHFDSYSEEKPAEQTETVEAAEETAEQDEEKPEDADKDEEKEQK